MPNRILKESICSSENVDALSIEAETFFYRLIVQCDDYGRMDARANILRARCFPLRLDKITDKHICEWVAELETAGLIQTYSVQGHAYLHFVKWDAHQQIRAKRSKYPDPIAADNDLQSSDINGNQVIANVPVIQSNPIQSQTNASPSNGTAKAAVPASGSKTVAIRNKYVELLGVEAKEVEWAAGESKAAEFIGEHWTVEQFAAAYANYKAEPFWSHKHLPLSYLKKELPEFIKGHRQPNAYAPSTTRELK